MNSNQEGPSRLEEGKALLKALNDAKERLASIPEDAPSKNSARGAVLFALAELREWGHINAEHLLSVVEAATKFNRCLIEENAKIQVSSESAEMVKGALLEFKKSLKALEEGA